MSDIFTIEDGQKLLDFVAIKTTDGTALATGTVNAYIKALSGANSGKWYRNSDSTWQATETANPMTAVGSFGLWNLLLTNSPFSAGVYYGVYAIDSGNTTIPFGKCTLCDHTPVADANRMTTANVAAWNGQEVANDANAFPVMVLAANQTLYAPAKAGDGMSITTGASNALLAANWNWPTAGMTTAGSIGKLLATDIDATISSRSAPGTAQTVDAASVRGAVGLAAANLDTQISTLQTSVNNINNLSALANIFGSPILEIPDAGNTLFPFTLTIRDSEGHLVDADATPTITATNAAGTDRSANLSAVTHAATGRYNFAYSVANTATREGLRVEATCNVGASARYAVAAASVEDYDTITSIGAIKAKTDLIATNAADSPNAVTTQTQAAAIFNKLPAGNIGDATAASQTSILQKFPANFSNVTIPANGTLSVTVAGYAAGMAPLQPTVPGRTLNVSATGQGGINWGDVANQGATVNLANTTIPGTGGGGGGGGGLTTDQAAMLQDIAAKVTAIGANPVTVFSAVATTGLVTLIRGDDYKATDARAISFGISGYDFTGATVKLVFTPFNCRCASATTITGTIIGATASFDVPAATTSALTRGENAYLYQLVATLADSSVVTLSLGSVNVLDPAKG